MPPDRKVSSIICDSDLWMRAKIAARQAPMTLGEWIEAAIGEKLEREQKTDKPNSQS